MAPPSKPDVMGYCDPAWISDYHFANALRNRLFDEGPTRAASLIAQEAKSLLLRGGMDAEGQPFLIPSFAFVLPVESGWGGSLASITLSGPGGSVTLDSGTDTLMFILVDSSTRQVRGILRDLPQAGPAALVH